jgi:hypothetical protein
LSRRICLLSTNLLILNSIIPLGIAGASQAVEFLLKNIDAGTADVGKLFDDVDFIIKRYSLKERLQLAIAETPQQYR